MSIPIVDLQVANDLYYRDEPFRIQLTFRGPNSRNTSGWSEKWWEISYSGSGPMMECNYGAVGSRGRAVPLSYPWLKAINKYHEKINKGYRQVSGTLTQTPPPVLTLIGPFMDIRELRQKDDDHFEAYDETGSFLLDLDAEGAEQMLQADQYRISVERLSA